MDKIFQFLQFMDQLVMNSFIRYSSYKCYKKQSTLNYNFNFHAKNINEYEKLIDDIEKLKINTKNINTKYLNIII